MKLYYIWQNENSGYDTFSDAVVAALSPAKARMTHPSQLTQWDGNDSWSGSWCKAKDVEVEFIGNAKRGTKAGVICASFHAG